MSAVLKPNTGASIAESVLNDILSRTSRYYYYLGKPLTWNPLGTDDPEIPKSNYQYELKTRSNIISTKRIKESDVSFVIKRIDWVINTVYDMYDDNYSSTNLSTNGFSALEDCNFYVVTNESNVYKCIANNSGASSTVMPSGYDTSIFTTADGYQWKFMYNIPIGFKNKFFEADFIPVTNSIKNQFYSRGQLSTVTIDNGGSGYVQASTAIVVSGDGYLENNPYILNGIVLTDGGIGYTSNPTATISPPNVVTGSSLQASATILRTGTSVTSATLGAIGFGYDTTATISIAEPISVYVVWQANIAVNANQIVKYQDRYYTVTTAGNLGTTPPIHTTGVASSGTASLTFTARRAKAYLTSTKTNAKITPVVNISGQITGVVLVDGGVGYSYANLDVAGVGVGANLSVDLSIGDLNTLQANVELLAVAGSLSYIKVENSGSGYTSASVIISGDGTGATATATLVSGKVININITNYGSNYTYATASVMGNGVNCTARVILSPLGGHGKNSILELNARTLMFFTSISNEKNQGITVNNDSRQLGIIKSLSRFNSDLSFRNDIGSACYLLTTPSNINQSQFFPDLRITSGQKEYYVVSVSENKLLIASLRNSVPVLGDVFSNANSNNITPILITPPTIDKYSGTMLFIDNRNAFSTSTDQSLSFRTTLKF